MLIEKYSTFGSSVYTPSYPEVSRHFDISAVAALVPLSVWTFGLGFGPLLGAPLSEMHGRKIVYMISTPISLLFTLGAGLSTTFAGMVICRFFGGVFGSPILAVGSGTIADIYPP
jgi:MFS family permease